jgi:hypothetical protein
LEIIKKIELLLRLGAMHLVETMDQLDHARELDQDLDLDLVLDLDQAEIVKKEAHARAMLQKMNSKKEDMRLWRWALRGIVIQ